MGGVLPTLTAEDVRRFWGKIQTGSPVDCWLWTGAAGLFGHGRFKVAGKLYSPHRIALTLARGPIPAGMVVMHLCDNPPCCNPTHLRTGSQSENSQDTWRKGRRRGRRAKLTPADVRAIRVDLRGAAALATAYGVTSTCISHIRTRTTWKHVA